MLYYVYITSMTYVCYVGGLWLHSVKKSGNVPMTG